MTTLSLFREPPPHIPDLRTYDWIAVSSSAGKDSQAMLDYMYGLAAAAGVTDRLIVIHADLGRVEWEGTVELAREHAAHYGLRCEVVSRIGGVAKKTGKTYREGETYGDILDYAERRGAWPDNQNRWCTSDFKRGPILKMYTQLAREWREANPGETRACRILDCMGLRAEESTARAKKIAFKNRIDNKNKFVDSWLPILTWRVGQVWARIRAAGTRVHPAYALGMPRLSCAFCIFAPKKALVLAGRHNRALLAEYVRVEEVTGHKFRLDVTMAEVQAAVLAGEDLGGDMDAKWNM